MKEVELCFGRFEDEGVLFNVLSVDFELEPRVYTFDDFSEFISNSGGYYIKLRYCDMPYGAAADALAKVLKLFERLKTEREKDFLDYIFIPREEVILDFTKCHHDYDVYDEMQMKMEWEDWYGHSLDALWDILTGLPYKGDDFVILRYRKYKNIKYGLDDYFTSHIDKVCQVFLEAQEEYKQIKVSIQYVDEI